MSCKLQNVFLSFSKVPWIALRLKITFLKFGKYFNVLRASITLGKLSGPPGTPGVFYKSYKNIYKLDKHSGISITSENCLGPPGTPDVFYKS